MAPPRQGPQEINPTVRQGLPPTVYGREVYGTEVYGAQRRGSGPASPIIFGDATVRPGSATSEAQLTSLLRDLPSGATVSQIAERAGLHPELRLQYADSASIVSALLELDATGAVDIRPNPVGDRLQQFYKNGHADGDSSLTYVTTYESNWRTNRDLYDFVEADDANHARKIFQRDIYLSHLGPRLDRLSKNARILDAGCGVGRLTGELITRGFRVTCADASAQALKCAVRVGLHHGANANSLEARLCDVRDLSGLEDGSYLATLALEVICYQEHPLVSLHELIRVTAPGGLIAISVEGVHGSSLHDPKIGLSQAAQVLDQGVLDLENEISVRYFTKRGVHSLLEEAGLENIEVVGTQYSADGVFDRLATDDALTDGDGIESLKALEKTAAADPALEPLARAWLATARVPGAPR